ncbi:unnamed protein product [Didymodactylos carnosus]|uniref:Uncharacterized protein n=2 Tax=Didymodactylos carnosus TaxID=1234261 RepID=A0A816ARM7_9BILA|nr:unnamed protein product [Didymodactylos carnosus]CAF4477322.1 unnamed protein product [Didymodactylos carnosus]
MYPTQANDLLQQLSTINFKHTNATSQPVTTAATTTTSATGRTDDLSSATAAAKEFIDTVRKFSRDTNPDPSHLLYGQPTTVAATVSDVVFVNPKLKSLILSGRYINLALLLLPYDGSQPKDFDIDTGKVLLLPRSSGDPHLRRILMLPEFLLAWSKYTTIFCEVYEQRRQELNKYQTQIITMAQRFPGPSFYFYHCEFAQKADALLSKNILLNWSVLDLELYCTLTSAGATACDLCPSVMHAAAFCPFAATGNSVAAPQSLSSTMTTTNNRTPFFNFVV